MCAASDLPEALYWHCFLAPLLPLVKWRQFKLQVIVVYPLSCVTQKTWDDRALANADFVTGESPSLSLSSLLRPRMAHAVPGTPEPAPPPQLPRPFALSVAIAVYKTVCPEVSHITKVDLKAMNTMESTLLQWLQFSVNVKGSTYAMYFMEMQSFALESNPKASRSKALTKKEQDLIAARIGQADEALQDAATRAGEEARRSLTLEDITFKRPAPIAIIS